MIYWGILIGLVIATISHWLAIFCVVRYKIKKNCVGKDHCNDCKESFLIDQELEYKYCPICGKELTYYKDDERYKHEIGLERPNEIDSQMSNKEV